MGGIRSARTVVVSIASLALLVVFGQPAIAGDYTTTSVTNVSVPSPFAGCDISGQEGTNYVHTEVEPWVEVNPSDPNNIIAVYQQDRWSNGGARGLVAQASHDGGTTWSTSWAHFSECSGGTPANGGDFERASDPWVTFSPNGVAYFMSLSVNFFAASESAMLVARSTDGGDTWSEPITLVRDSGDEAPFLFHDKNSMTADPLDSSYVYAVWDRVRFPSDRAGFNAQHAFSFRSDAMFARTTDGGITWEPARALFEPKSNTFTIGHQIAVTPDGTLIDIFDMGQGSGNNFPGFDMAIMRSTDHGETWTDPIAIAEEHAVGVVDPETGVPLRVGAGLPDIAVDMSSTSPGYGNVYAVWADAGASAKHHKTAFDSVVLTMSSDGGLTWSELAEIDRSPAGVDAFTPSVAVASDGTVGVTYYDLRNNTPDPGLPTDTWMIHCHPTVDCTDPANWAENHVDGPFDMELAPVANGYFVGDYEGLATIGDGFVPLFSQTTPGDKADAFYATVEPV